MVRFWGVAVLVLGGLTAAGTDIRWDLAPLADDASVGPQVAVGGSLAAVPTQGRAHRAQSVLRWDETGEGLRFSNGADAVNEQGVFLRVPDQPALTGHDGGGYGFSSLRLSVRVRLGSLGRTQSLLRKTQLSTEFGYLLCVNADGGVRFAVGTVAGKASVTSGSVHLEPGKWYDIVGVWEEGEAAILIDDKPCGGTARIAGPLGDTAGPLAIGAIDRGRGSTGQFLDGTLRMARIQGVVSKQPPKGASMAADGKTTAWGTPIRQMWSCPPQNWGAPARGMPVLKGVCHAAIFEPEFEDGAYNHHPEIIRHHGRFHVMWSNNMVGEDRAGQRILYSSTGDPTRWPEARSLFPQPGPFFDNRTSSGPEAGGRHGFYMTAMKFVPLGERLFAIAAFDSTQGHLVPLARELREDGSWGRIFALHGTFSRKEEEVFPFAFLCPEEEPYRSDAASLLKLYLTPQFLPSWNFGIERLFPRPLSVEGNPLCEWTIHRARDGKRVILARDPRMSHRMYAAVSDSDDPKSFPPLAPTDIPDTPSKAVTLNLPNGTVLLVGNQVARDFDNIDKPTHYDRDPLSVSVSEDGYRFTRQYALRWEGGRRWRTECRRVPGRGAGCQYPAAMLDGDMLYVVYSIGKEDIALSWVPLARLGIGSPAKPK